jgi:hypothetical protein
MSVAVFGNVCTCKTLFRTRLVPPRTPIFSGRQQPGLMGRSSEFAVEARAGVDRAQAQGTCCRNITEAFAINASLTQERQS